MRVDDVTGQARISHFVSDGRSIAADPELDGPVAGREIWRDDLVAIQVGSKARQ
jgi:hypothetical protein